MFLRFLVYSFLSLAPLSAATLHVVLVCDTHASQIGWSVSQNHIRMRAMLRDVAELTEMTYSEQSFISKMTTTHFLNQIDNLVVKDDDVLFFYWAGHGYRSPSIKTPWPTFHFSDENVGLDQYALTQRLRKKGARLTLCISDTCNNYLRDQDAPEPYIIKTAPLTLSQLKKNGCALFLETRGTIICASALPGQFSWYHINGGGYFTRTFLESIYDELQENEASWEHLSHRLFLNLNAIRLPSIQSPQFEHFDA